MCMNRFWVSFWADKNFMKGLWLYNSENIMVCELHFNEIVIKELVRSPREIMVKKKDYKGLVNKIDM